MAGTDSSRQMLVVFFGMTASGKSYLAEAWAKTRGCQHFNTDVVRKESAGRDLAQFNGDELDEGIYSPESTRRTYDLLLDYADKAFAADSSACVVLDGSYQRRSERAKVVKRFADRLDMYFILCGCSESVTRARLQERLQDDTAVSDGNLDVYIRQQKTFEAPVEIHSEKLLELDTSASLEYLIDRLEQFLSTSGLQAAACGNSTDNP